jgi:cytochrome c
MKKILVLMLVVVVLISCKKETAEPFGTPSVSSSESTSVSGKDLFEGKGKCSACHLPDKKVIGPSITEIAKIYKEKNGDMVDFLKEKAEPIVDPAQYEVMKTNFSITKTMTDEELKAVEEYFYSFLKN